MVQDGCSSISFHGHLLASRKSKKGAEGNPTSLKDTSWKLQSYYFSSSVQVAIENYHKLGGLQTAEDCLENGKSKIKVPGESASVESPLPGSQIAIFLSSHGGRGKEALWGLFFNKGTNPIHGASTFMI